MEKELFLSVVIINCFFFESANVENKYKCHTQPYISL